MHLLPPRLQVPLARRPPLGLTAVRRPGLLQCAVGPRRLAQLALQLQAVALCRGVEGRGWEGGEDGRRESGTAGMRTVEEATARGAGATEGGRQGGGRLGGRRRGVVRLRLRAKAAQLLQLGLQPLGRPRRLARPGRLAPRAQLLLFGTRLHLRQCLEGPATPRHCCLSHSPSLTPAPASPPHLPSGSDPRPPGPSTQHTAAAHR